jgi:fucose 4-O-acetylase-like acetyltransferase
MTAARQFDMPIFCFVSGLCSQGVTNQKRVIGYITGIIAPWLLFRLLAEPFLYNPLRDLGLWNLRDVGNPHPVYDDWYMVALICWKAVTLTFSWTNPYKLCAGMIVASFIFEYIDLSVSLAPFAFTRTFKFLPYYAIGYIWPRQTILQAPSFSCLDVTQKAQVCCLLGFGAFLMLPFWMDVFGTDFSDTFTSSDQFQGMPADFTLAWIQIIARVTKNMMIVIPVMVFLLPKDETIFTSIGRLTLYPYFLHRILLEHRLTFVTHGPPPVWTSNFAHVCVYLGHYGFCVAVCMLLTSVPVRMLFGWAIEPKWLDRFFDSILPAEQVNKPSKAADTVMPDALASSGQKSP